MFCYVLEEDKLECMVTGIKKAFFNFSVDEEQMDMMRGLLCVDDIQKNNPYVEIYHLVWSSVFP